MKSVLLGIEGGCLRHRLPKVPDDGIDGEIVSELVIMVGVESSDSGVASRVVRHFNCYVDGILMRRPSGNALEQAEQYCQARIKQAPPIYLLVLLDVVDGLP